MLYDPKWDQQTKADPFSLESLIAWLETMPAKIEYCYQSNGRCLLGQYFSAQGFGPVSVGARDFWCREDPKQTDIDFPEVFGDIAWERPRTFGAALQRARTALTSTMGAKS